MRQPLSPSELGAIFAASAIAFFVLSSVFQVPYSNQNAYLLHASVSADNGLAGDWLAGTADPFPLATLLTRAALQFGDIGVHALSFICSSAFLLALLIFGMRFGFDETSRATLLFSVFLLTLPFVEPALPVFANARFGAANQSLLAGYWQPSVGAGTALAIAVLAFAAGRSHVSAVLIALAVSLHPGYLLAGAILMVVICGRLLGERRTSEGFFAGTVCLVLILPILGYVLVTFGGTDASSLAQAQAILARERIPHHAIPLAWLSLGDGARVVLVVVAALLWYEHARLFWTLIGCTLLAVAGTVLAMILDQDALYLLFPWRISAVLTPLSYGLIALRLAPVCVYALTRRRRGRTGLLHGVIAAGFAGLFTLSLSAGAVRGHAADGLPLGLLPHVQPDPGLAPERLTLYEWVASNTPPGSVYLVPVELGGLRLSAGQPVYVDAKVHPYKDVEVIEWKRRLENASAAYAAADGCGRPALAADAMPEVTRVVFRKTGACVPQDGRLYENDVYAVIDRAAAASR